MAAARAAGSRSGTRSPLRPCSTSSGTPATVVETTGSSMAIASTSTLGIPSVQRPEGDGEADLEEQHGVGEDLPPSEIVGHARQDEEIGLAVVAEDLPLGLGAEQGHAVVQLGGGR